MLMQNLLPQTSKTKKNERETRLTEHLFMDNVEPNMDHIG